MKRIILLLVVVGCILAGCTPNLVAKQAPLVGGEKLNFLHTPVESLGVRATENFLKGDVFIVAGTFPERAFAEEYPGRISWKGWVVNLETEREFYAQVVRAGVREDGTFVEYFMADDKSVEAMKGVGVLLSSNLSWIADLAGNIYPLDASQWQVSKAYRLEVMSSCGSPLRNALKVSGFEKTALGWNRYQLKGIGEILAPYGTEQMKEIAGSNPAYSLLDKLALKGNLSIFIDPIATASNLALNIIMASGVKSEGWDYTSNLPNREVMGAIIEFVGKFRLELIGELNQKISQKKTEDKDEKKFVSVGSASGVAGPSGGRQRR